jgi:hypothetical protein
MAEQERFEWVVLGRVIGTATGWDQADTFVMQIYDFEPDKEINLPKADCLTIDFEKGVAQIYDDDGQLKQDFDLINILKNSIKSS